MGLASEVFCGRRERREERRRAGHQGQDRPPVPSSDPCLARVRKRRQRRPDSAPISPRLLGSPQLGNSSQSSTTNRCSSAPLPQTELTLVYSVGPLLQGCPGSLRRRNGRDGGQNKHVSVLEQTSLFRLSIRSPALHPSDWATMVYYADKSYDIPPIDLLTLLFGPCSQTLS